MGVMILGCGEGNGSGKKLGAVGSDQGLMRERRCVRNDVFPIVTNSRQLVTNSSRVLLSVRPGVLLSVVAYLS